MAAGLAVALAACAPGGGSSDGTVELTYGIWDDAQRPAMEQIIDEFEAENPNVTVRITLTPWDSYWTRLNTSATGGTAPDLYWVLNDRIKYYASGGAAMNLDELVERDGIDLDQYVPSSLEGAQFDGSLYGLPKDTNSFALFYNRQLFADAGVAVPDDTWTWDDLLEAAKALTDPDAGVYGIGAPVTDVLTWYLTVPQAGGHVISEDGTTSGYDDPATIEGLQFWSDLINVHHVSPTIQQLAETDNRSRFTSGQIAMYYGGSWDPVALAAVPYASENVDIAPLPKNPRTGERSFYANGIANVMFSGTPHPEEAWEFLKFLGSPRAADIQASTGTVIPGTSGRAAEYVAAYPQFTMQALIDGLPDALPIPSSINTAVWADLATQEFTKAWSGTMTVPEAAKVVADGMNKALAEEG